MAKEDFCFTYYDGDACRDMSHMNRLERGAYNDLVLQQRKFGRLSLEQIKKVLGKDFEECWPSVNLVLIFDETEQKYFIEWLEKSVKKMRAHAQHQSKRGKGNAKKVTEPEPDSNQTQTEPEPTINLKEDGNGNGIEDKDFKYQYESLEKKVELLEEKVTIALDELYLDQQRVKWSHINFDFELNTFREKVRGSPGEYLTRDTDGIRLAFQYQLRKATSKPNGINQTTGKKQQHTANLAASVAKTYSRVFTGGTNGQGSEPPAKHD
jgi:hypothetical protein